MLAIYISTEHTILNMSERMTGIEMYPNASEYAGRLAFFDERYRSYDHVQLHTNIDIYCSGDPKRQALLYVAGKDIMTIAELEMSDCYTVECNINVSIEQIITKSKTDGKEVVVKVLDPTVEDGLNFESALQPDLFEEPEQVSPVVPICRRNVGRAILSIPPHNEDVLDDWRSDAACLGVGGDLFFPTKGSSAHAAKRICASCPVTNDCLEFSLENNEQYGVWGGLSESERQGVRRRRKNGGRSV